MEKLLQHPKGGMKQTKDANKKHRKGKKGQTDTTTDGDDVVEVAPPPPEAGPRYPPYMKPLLKPSRSDPTLLSSYGDDQSMLTKPPYHHYRPAMQHGDVTTVGAVA